MSALINPAFNYDPVTFVYENQELILPSKSRIINIEFSGFYKKKFHSNKRPKGYLTIFYMYKQEMRELRIFLKQHSNALRVHNHVSNVYSHFASLKTFSHIPKPIICDDVNEVNYMEYVPGSQFTFQVLKDLLLLNTDHMRKMFFNIGQWLKNYHNAVKLQSTFDTSYLKDEVLLKLKSTDLFSKSEKSKISSHLKYLNFDGYFKFKVKSHNDFVMRNLIYTKSFDFYIIDWDAMYNENFETESSVWIDITSFIISLESLQRFAPIIGIKSIKSLTNSFLRGYFYNNGLSDHKNGIENHIYLYTLCYYLGVIGEQPLPTVYKNKFGHRYISKLRSDLVNLKM